MATLTLDRQHTALLIADFYAAFMSILPHALAAADPRRRAQTGRVAGDGLPARLEPRGD